MEKGVKESFKKYIFIVAIILIIFLTYKIIEPYLLILISAFILAYIIRPIHIKLSKKIPKSLSAMLCILIILLIILIPLTAITGGILNQTQNVLTQENLISIQTKISNFPFLNKFDFDSLIKSGASMVANSLLNLTKQIPSLIISIMVLVFGIYYILIDWDPLIKELKKYLSLKEKDKTAKDKTAKEISSITQNLIYGTLLIALIEFIVAVIGFYFSGVTAYLLIPVAIFFFAFIPGLGPTIVWIPMAIYYAIVQNWPTAIGVLITGIILSTFVDTIIRTKILGKKTKTNPLIMLVGILGGISLFGIFGFIIGPLILIYTIKIMQGIVE